MTDEQENDVLETGDLDAEAGLEDFDTGGKGGFAQAWKTNPMVKIGTIIAGLVVIVGGFMLLGGGSKPVSPSVMATSRQKDAKEAPGGSKVPELYKEALIEVNKENAEKAAQTGESNLPVPVGASRNKIGVEVQKDNAEDPLERWRRIQEERARKEEAAKVSAAQRQAAAAPAVQAQAADPYATQKQNLSSSMQTQMQSVLEAQGIKQTKSVDVTDADYTEKKQQEKAQKQQQVQAAAAAASAPQQVAEVLIEPGRIEYAQLVIEANSDVPGPVIADLASGPLVGDRLIGSFTKEDDFLVLKFDTVVVDGVGLSADAIALDPDTSRPGLVTDIDHKYFERIIIPAASAFISGLGGAIANSGSTTVSAGQGTATTAQNPLNPRQEFYKGVSKAADKVSTVLDADAAKAQPRVRVAAGTRIGILFTKAVVRSPDGQNVQPTDQSAAGTQANAGPPAGAQQLLLQIQPQMLQAAQAQAATALSGSGSAAPAGVATATH